MGSSDFIDKYQFMSRIPQAEYAEASYRWERGEKANTFAVPKYQHSVPAVEPFFDGRIIVRVSGPITTKRQPAFDELGIPYTSCEEVIREMSGVIKGTNVRSIILMVDSQGGDPAGSQRFAHYIRQVGLTMPIQTIITGDAMSGALLVAVAAGPGNVFAEVPFNQLGSIGVISQYKKALPVPADDPSFVIKEKRLGVFKAAASIPQPTEEIKDYVDDRMLFLYDGFCRDLAEFRSLPIENIKEIADGRTFYAEEAISVGLCDGLLDLKRWYVDHEIHTLLSKK